MVGDGVRQLALVAGARCTWLVHAGATRTRVLGDEAQRLRWRPDPDGPWQRSTIFGHDVDGTVFFVPHHCFTLAWRGVVLDVGPR